MRKSKQFNRKRKYLERRTKVSEGTTVTEESIGKMSVASINKWFGTAISTELREEPVIIGQPGVITRVNNGNKTVILDNWMEVVKLKVILDSARRDFKEKLMHRVAALKRYSMKQRAEADLIRRFTNKVGSPLTTIMYVCMYVCMYIYTSRLLHLTWCFNIYIYSYFGDGNSQFFASLRGHNYSIKGIGTIRLFQRNGYRVYLVNEGYTSKR